MWNILIGCLPVDGTTNAVAEEKYDSEENGEPKSEENGEPKIMTRMMMLQILYCTYI